MIGYVYRIEIGNKFYYGQTVNPSNRKSQHLSRLKKGIHKNPHMQNCFNKYDNFSMEVIATVTSVEYLNELEQFYIDRHYDNNLCMNSCRIASRPPSPIGKKHSAETKAKIGAAHRGKKKNPNSVAKQATSRSRRCYGRPLGTTDWIEFKSGKAAAEHMGGHASKVSDCILGRYSQHKGWEFTREVTDA